MINFSKIFEITDLPDVFNKRGPFLNLGPHSELTDPNSFEIRYFLDQLNKSRNFSEIRGYLSELSGLTYFEITDLPYLFNETMTFSKIWGPQSTLTGLTSFEITDLPDL